MKKTLLAKLSLAVLLAANLASAAPEKGGKDEKGDTKKEQTARPEDAAKAGKLGSTSATDASKTAADMHGAAQGLRSSVSDQVFTNVKNAIGSSNPQLLAKLDAIQAKQMSEDAKFEEFAREASLATGKTITAKDLKEQCK